MDSEPRQDGTAPETGSEWTRVPDRGSRRRTGITQPSETIPPDRPRIGRNNKARGKAVEREVARLVDGKRNPDNGAQQGDVYSPLGCLFCLDGTYEWHKGSVVEVKSRQTASPSLMKRAWSQALAAAEETGREPWMVLSYVDGGRRTYWIVKEMKP